MKVSESREKSKRGWADGARAVGTVDRGRLGGQGWATRAIDYSDIPPLDKAFFKKATVAWPPVKKQLTIRLDADVLEWLKGQGRGYQTRINRILRVVMESQSPGQAHR